MGEEDSASKTAKCRTFTKITGIISGIVLIGFGIAGIVYMAVNALLSGKFFLVFSPIFMILFGMVILAMECNITFLARHFGFLNSLMGKGVFNIQYLYPLCSLSTIVFYYFSCGSDNDVLAWIGASLLFIVGIVFMVLSCCGGAEDEASSVNDPMVSK